MDGFERMDSYATFLDRQYLHAMEADRIWAVGRTRAEYALRGSREVIAGMDAQEVATGTIEPRKQEDLISDANPIQGVRRPGLKDEQGFGCSFVPLLRGGARASQGRFDPSDWRQLEAPVVHFAPHQAVTGSGTSQPQLS